MICTSGPQDHPFEERHSHVSIAVVVAGSFEYHSRTGRALMTPGSLMLGNAGQCYECGHAHGAGDRCVAFWYTPEYFERIAADAGARGRRVDFHVPKLPPLRALAPLTARAGAGLAGQWDQPWEELAVMLAVTAVRLAAGEAPVAPRLTSGSEARVSRAVRQIERRLEARLTLGGLAREAGLSPYHFLRTFQLLTGVTPHQFVLRSRLRKAAIRLALEPARVLDIALDCGFGDVSNFNRAFRAEFGVNPRRYRTSTSRT